MKLYFCIMAIAILPVIIHTAPDEKVISEAHALRERGEFAKATEVLQNYMDQTSSALSAEDRIRTEFEIERMRRIRLDYGTSRQDLLKSMQDRLTTFSEDELDHFEREGQLDIQMIDGQKLYSDVSASNLLFKYRELRERLKQPSRSGSLRRLYQSMQQVKTAFKKYPEPYLVYQDFLVTASLVVKPNQAPEGSVLRAWLPYAGAFPYQTDQVILASNPPDRIVSPAEHAHRTVYVEHKAVKDKPTTFSVEFVFRTWSQNFAPDPAKVLPYDKDSVDYIKYTAEKKPHIDFSSEELKKISIEAVGNETNPLLIAKRLYDWVSKNTIYQYAREYSTIENLSQYCAERRAGDCGQHGMLFIALCRMNGVPARWTTGWELFSHRGQGMHDWAEIFIEPYGWMPVDVDMAVNARTLNDDALTTQQAEELADWFFGNMDNMRLTVNRDFGEPLYPAKQHFRSETVDFQRGEVESESANLYFNQWTPQLRAKPITSARADQLRQQHIPAPPALPQTPQPVKPSTPVLSIESGTTTTVASAPGQPTPQPTNPENSNSSETKSKQGSVEKTAVVDSLNSTQTLEVEEQTSVSE